MRVVDASVAVKWFVEEDGRDFAMAIVRSGELLVAPDIVVLEVLNVLRRKQRQGSVDVRQVIGAMETMTLCFDRFVPSIELAREALSFSMALDHSVYDCAYLACATSIGASLVTADKVFASKAVAHKPGLPVHVLGSP